MATNRFKKLSLVNSRLQVPDLAAADQPENRDAPYWKHLQYPCSVQESGPVSHIECSPVQPHYIAVTGTARVKLYHPETQEAVKTFTKLKEGSIGASFRSDGQVLAVGSDDGPIKVFAVGDKTQLRTFKGHTNAVHGVKFLSSLTRLTSFSDDSSVRIWDMPTQEQLACYDGHSDYVRAGCTSETSEHLFVSGSYDHTVRLWDQRTDASVLSVDHGSPVEALLLMPGDGLLASAGGHEVRIWDMLAGGKLLTKMTPHNKTITSLGFAYGRRRLVTASLDCQLKMHDLATFQTTYSVKFPSPILTACVLPNDSLIAAGMTSGLVQFMQRKSSAEVEAERVEKKRQAQAQSHRYLQFTEFTPSSGDLLVKSNETGREQPYDRFLRKFEYSRALDYVLKPYLARMKPELAYSMLQELKRRRGLRRALAGRADKSLLPILHFLVRHINNIKYADFLIEVTNEVLDLYSNSLGKSHQVDKLVLDLTKRVQKESEVVRNLMALQGSLDLILSASKISDKPVLRREELAMKEQLAGKQLCAEFPLSLDKIF